VTVDSDDEGFLWDIQEKFSFYVPNYRFQPKYQAGIWDGKIRLYSPYRKKLYTGLLYKLNHYCKNNNIDIKIDPLVNQYNKDIDEQSFKEYVDNLNLHASGKPITPYDYQYIGAFHALKYSRATLLSPTASGKSLIVYMMSRYFQDNNDKKTLIVVPTTSLVAQLYSDFDDYASETDWTSEENCHQIYQGQKKVTNKDIVISTWQSIYKNQAKYFMQFDAVIVDECHQLKANSLTGILEKCQAKYKIGLTGTLDDAQAHELVIQGLLGPKKVLATTKELMEDGQVTDLNINILNLNYNEQDKKEVRTNHKKYQDEVNYIINHKKRNNFICNMANNFKDNTLVLFLKIDHGKELKKILDEMVKKTGKQVYLVYGDIKTDERERIRKLTEKSNDVIIVASYGTFSTGINIKNLHNIILASPTKSKIRVLQSIGRILRLYKNKFKAELYDIVDDFSHKSYRNYAVKHFAKRFSYYSKEKFDYKTIPIKL
jgi:superfamily II DNA or RNA helicase